MKAKAIGSNCGAKEYVQILIKTYSETGMKADKRNDVALLSVNLVIFALGEPFIDLIHPTGTGIGINIKRTHLTLSQMKIAAIIKRCGYCIHITRRIIVIRVVIAKH